MHEPIVELWHEPIFKLSHEPIVELSHEPNAAAALAHAGGLETGGGSRFKFEIDRYILARTNLCILAGTNRCILARANLCLSQEL
jgi:hypothetical protein